MNILLTIILFLKNNLFIWNEWEGLYVLREDILNFIYYLLNNQI